MPQAAPNQPTAEDIATQAAQERLENAEALNLNTEDRLPPSRTTTRPQQNQNLSDDDYDREAENTVVHASPQDTARNAIINKFRHAAPQDEKPFSGDMSDPENLYGDHGRAPSADLDEDESIVGTALDDDDLDPDLDRQTPQRAQQPTKKKVTVRGKVLEMTDDEILAAAQKTLAGDSYLEDAKAILAEAKQIKARRVASDNQHPDYQEDAPTLDGDDDGADVQHPEPTFRDVIQKIQYGDPDEAAIDLERIVDSRTTKQVTESHVQRLFNNDLLRSQKALKKFVSENTDLADDEIAAMAIEKGMYRLYKEDILKLGMAEDQIPTDAATIANWHRWYRVHGYEVRNTSDLLNASRDNFAAWRDGKAPGRRQQQQQQPRRAEPRVLVNVDRNARRAAIPNQPTRTVTPVRQQQAPAPVTRSDVVANMRRARGQV